MLAGSGSSLCCRTSSDAFVFLGASVCLIGGRCRESCSCSTRGSRGRHLPLELGFGSGSICYRRMVEWQQAGVLPSAKAPSTVTQHPLRLAAAQHGVVHRITTNTRAEHTTVKS